MKIENIIVHAPYLINLANCEDDEKYNLSIRLLKTEVERTLKIGCKYLVLHPGCSLKADKLEAIKRVASALNQIFELYPTIYRSQTNHRFNRQKRMYWSMFRYLSYS